MVLTKKQTNTEEPKLSREFLEKRLKQIDGYLNFFRAIGTEHCALHIERLSKIRVMTEDQLRLTND